MSNINEIARRLRDARIKAGYKTATDAAEALGIKYPTYAGHENGSRAIGNELTTYARRFHVSIDWLLTGKGKGPDDKDPKSNNREKIFTDLFSQIKETDQDTVLKLLKSLAAANKG